MRLSLPYSRERRYLSGIDWSVGMLDHLTRKACGLGNTSQVVLEIDGSLPVADLEAQITRFLARLPALHGRPARDRNLCPFWRERPAPEDAPSWLTRVALPQDASPAAVLQALATGVHRPLGSETQHLAFLLLTLGARRSYLALAFDHWLLDARGAEMLLSLLLQHIDGRALHERLGALLSPQGARLDGWARKFAAGRRVNRHLLFLREGRTASLPRPAAFTTSRTRYALVSFDEPEARRIVDTAYGEAGYLMLQSFVLAAVLQALAPLYSARARGTLPATDYVVPVSVDMRGARDAEALVFFNHLSFLFFKIPTALVGDRARTAAHLSEQLVAQVKAGLPQDLAEAADLMRIAPLPWLGRLARVPLRGELASFTFAQLAKAAPHEPSAWRGRTRNIFHMPRIPIPPGLGVVANQFGGRLNLVLSAHEQVVSESELAEVAERLRRLPRSCAASPGDGTPAAAGSAPATD